MYERTEGSRMAVRRPVAQAVVGETPGDIAEWARVRLEFEPDEMQARVPRSRPKRMILNRTRQWGKSTVTAARAVYAA